MVTEHGPDDERERKGGRKAGDNTKSRPAHSSSSSLIITITRCGCHLGNY